MTRRALVGGLLAVLFYVVPAEAIYSLKAHTSAQSADTQTVVTSAIDTTGADLIVVVIAGNTSLALGLSDSKSNTWTCLTQQAAGFAAVLICYVQAPTVGSGHTFTYADAGGPKPTLLVGAWSGSTASPFDQQNGATATATTLATGSVTPTQDNELIVAGRANTAADAGGIDSGFGPPLEDQTGTAGCCAAAGSLAYIVQGTAAATNPTFNWDGNSRDAAVAIATFKAAAGGGGTVPCIIGGGFFRAGCL